MEPSLQLLPPELGAFAAALSPLIWLVGRGEPDPKVPCLQIPKMCLPGTLRVVPLTLANVGASPTLALPSCHCEPCMYACWGPATASSCLF